MSNLRWVEPRSCFLPLYDWARSGTIAVDFEAFARDDSIATRTTWKRGTRNSKRVKSSTNGSELDTDFYFLTRIWPDLAG
jgi:hypothetical protein